MSSSLLAGVSGLRANQEMLDVVGNNLANVNTTGFKSQTVLFDDLLYQTLTPATGTDSSKLGGTDPQQIGSGVGIASIATNLQQGTLNATGNNLDLAIQGAGYFVVHNGSQDLYTRAGSFAVDKNGMLVDPTTGYQVQRVGTVGEGSATSTGFQTPGNLSISIPASATLPGKPTSTVNFTGNLNSGAVGPLAEVLTSGQPYTVGGTAATSATLLNSLDGRTAPYQAGDRILISGTDANGAAVSSSLNVGPATTLNDLLTSLNGAYRGATASLDSRGNLLLTANATGPAALSLTLADAPGNQGSFSFGSHGLSVTVNGKNGDTLNTAIQVFDSQGTAHSLSLTFQKQGNNVWSMSAAINPAEGTMVNNTVTGIQFNDDGSFRQVSSTGAAIGTVSFLVKGLSSAQNVGVSFGTLNGFNGVTQFGAGSSVAASSQDGYAAGSLSSLSVAPDGTVQGIFTNGRTLAIAQLALANFTNPGGLNRQGTNYYSLSNDSGLPQVGTASSGGLGQIEHGELEQSNVDVSLEFTRLITAQRGFAVNARTITVSDQVLQQLTNIIQ